jgi:hypothetical protein
MDPTSLWPTLGGSAILVAALTFARLLLDYGFRVGDRRIEVDERRQARERDAEARLERVLRDRLADADRRLERYALDLHAEQARWAVLEREHARLQQAYDQLREQYLNQQAQFASPRATGGT